MAAQDVIPAPSAFPEAAQKVRARGGALAKEFKQFMLRGNVVDLAIAVVIGAAFSSVISALVEDLVTPLIAAIGGKPHFEALTFTLNNSVFKYGDLLNKLISFLLVGGVVFFFIVKPVNALLARSAPKGPAVPRTMRCPECLSDIPIGASRCAHCTAELKKA